MNTKKAILLASLCIIITITINNSASSIKAIPDKYINFYTIDGFEKPGEWQVKFSKFRSAKWNKNDKTKRDPDKDWYGWFVTDDKNLKKKEILPSFIYKNNSILKKEKTILGIKTKWDKHGYNWISIEPHNNNKSNNKERYSENKFGRYPDQIPHNHNTLNEASYLNYDKGNYILIPARSSNIGLFVWNNNKTNYTLEFHVEDDKEQLYVINAGNVKFNGWRRLTANLPYSIIHSNKPAKLKKIRLVSNPTEKIIAADTYIYIDYLHSKITLSNKDFVGKGLEQSKKVWKHRISN